MSIKITGYLFTPKEGGPCTPQWRIYGTKKVFNYEDGRLAPLPASWELVAEFEMKNSRGKIGFPDFKLEPTTETGWRFYRMIGVDKTGKEIWHKDDTPLTLPPDLPEEFEPPFDVATWLLWNLEREGVIAPGQLRD
jgi:hypothetical protein